MTGVTTDTGSSPSDGITSDTSLTINGMAEANSTVTVFDGASNLGTTTANGSGAWSFVDSRTLADGSSHSYTATATDTAGNTSGASAAFAVTIDTASETATVDATATQSATNANSTGIVFSVVFNNFIDSATFTSADITFGGATSIADTNVTLSVAVTNTGSDNKTFVVTVTNSNGGAAFAAGDMVQIVVASGAAVTDVAGNSTNAPTITNDTVTLN